MAKIRVVLADQHSTVVQVRQILGEDFEVVAAMENGKQAVDAVCLLDPDVLVVGISLPVLDGLQVAKRLQAANCRAKIVMLSIYKDQDFVAAALSAGASAYVTKDRLANDLLSAISEALLGHTFASQIARR